MDSFCRYEELPCRAEKLFGLKGFFQSIKGVVDEVFLIVESNNEYHFVLGMEVGNVVCINNNQAISFIHQKPGSVIGFGGLYCFDQSLGIKIQL